MSTATLEHEEIKADQVGEIFRALRNKGTACKQSPAGERTGPWVSAAGALIDTDGTATEEIVVRLFAALASGSSDGVVAMHARSLVFHLAGQVADLNATAIENGNAPQTRFREF